MSVSISRPNRWSQVFLEKSNSIQQSSWKLSKTHCKHGCTSHRQSFMLLPLRSANHTNPCSLGWSPKSSDKVSLRVRWDLNEGNSKCMVKFTPFSISPSHHSMERLSLIFPAFLNLIILPQFVDVQPFLMMCLCMQQDGGSCRLHAESLFRRVGLLTKLRPPQHRGEGVTHRRGKARAPTFPFPWLRLFNGFHSYLPGTPNKMA